LEKQVGDQLNHLKEETEKKMSEIKNSAKSEAQKAIGINVLDRVLDHAEKEAKKALN